MYLYIHSLHIFRYSCTYISVNLAKFVTKASSSVIKVSSSTRKFRNSPIRQSSSGLPRRFFGQRHYHCKVWSIVIMRQENARFQLNWVISWTFDTAAVKMKMDSLFSYKEIVPSSIRFELTNHEIQFFLWRIFSEIRAHFNIAKSNHSGFPFPRTNNEIVVIFFNCVSNTMKNFSLWRFISMGVVSAASRLCYKFSELHSSEPT